MDSSITKLSAMYMDSFFRDVFAYHHHFNQRLIGEIRKHLPVLPEKAFPLFCHILNAHQIWNSRIRNIPSSFQVHQLHEAEHLHEIDQRNYEETLIILDEEQLDRIVVYKTSKGEEFSHTISEILFHVVNHTTHHRGQLIAFFRPAGVEPLVTDYIFYKRPSTS